MQDKPFSFLGAGSFMPWTIRAKSNWSLHMIDRCKCRVFLFDYLIPGSSMANHHVSWSIKSDPWNEDSRYVVCVWNLGWCWCWSAGSVLPLLGEANTLRVSEKGIISPLRLLFDKSDSYYSILSIETRFIHITVWAIAVSPMYIFV